MADDPADALYALPLEEFTPARDAAAKALRKAGDREAAARLAKLPKPTPAAWTANQVAREHPDVVAGLLEAGAGLREAQEAALSGAGGEGLRDATASERRAVDAVMDVAGGYHPGGRPLSAAMAERLRTTLHAAAADETLSAALEAGRLVDEAQAGGAWPFALEPAGEEPEPAPRRRTPKRRAKRGAAQPEPEPEPEPVPTRRPSTRERRKAEAEERRTSKAAEREAAEAARAELEAQLKDARGELRVRERGLRAAEKDAVRAQAEAEAAAEALKRAAREAEDATADAEAAARLLADARAALERARDNVARLEERLD